jgi:hypothetical protein
MKSDVPSQQLLDSGCTAGALCTAGQVTLEIKKVGSPHGLCPADTVACELEELPKSRNHPYFIIRFRLSVSLLD